MRKYRRYGLANALVFLVFLIVATHYGWLNQPAQKAMQNQPGLYAVKNFVDGDTIDVDMNGRSETVRFIGVDTPETHKPNTPVQCYGPEASSFTKMLIGSNSVRLQADPLDTNRDRYGRLLRYVYLPDGTLVESKLISEGYGFAYTQFPFQKKDQFVSLEQTAKQAGKGLWSACQVTIEASGRRQTNSL
jgi:endonuclease YncB( thermonuclease family)